METEKLCYRLGDASLDAVALAIGIALWYIALLVASGQQPCPRALYAVVRWLDWDSYWRIPEEAS